MYNGGGVLIDSASVASYIGGCYPDMIDRLTLRTGFYFDIDFV
jgi:hypothetical protein